MLTLFVLLAFLFVAIVGPFIIPNPAQVFDTKAISDVGGRPVLPNGGISSAHPLGVEWGTGRDILGQLIYGLRISLIIAASATLITVVLGTVIGIFAGYAGGMTDTIIGRFMDLILAFPFLLIILALSGVLTQRLTDLGVRDMLLLTSSKTVLPGSAGYGLKILGRVPLD